ncbi:MAG: FmdB family zinc ribbon protein [Candidatus Promineifilaceae bacterium]
MPLYEFECRDCASSFAERRPFSQASRAGACPACGSLNTYKPLSKVAVHAAGRARPTGQSIPLSLAGSGCACGGRGCGCRH